MSLKILFLFLLIKALQISANDCYTYLIEDTPTSFTCSSSGSYSASTSLTPLVQNPSKELTVAISIKPTSLCGLSSGFNFLTVSINTNLGFKRIMMATFDGSSSITLNSEDSSATPKTALTKSVTFLNKEMNLFLSVNLASNTFSAGVLADDGNMDNAITTISYGSDWVFDSSLIISGCSDYDGSNAIACTVDNIKVLYSYYSSSTIVNTGHSVTLIGDYRLNDVAGSTTAVNSQTAVGSLASATFSTPAPTWVSNVGLQFTSASQHIQLPAFVPSSADQLISASIAFTFYIKIDSTPTADTTILNYWGFNIAMSILQLQITSNMKLKSGIIENMGGPTAEGTTVLALGEWNQVYISFLITQGTFMAALVQINGGSIDSFPSMTGGIGSGVFSTSDLILIGAGFIGQLRRFQVYSPAALELSSESCDPTICAVNLGFSDPPTCLEAVCNSGTYVSFGTCESCPTGCATCSDTTTCETCSQYYYLSATSCLGCPSHCTSCSDSQTCKTCDAGYGLYDNLCKICPSGTTLTKDQVCQEFSETLKDTLSTSQTLSAAITQVVNAISKGSSVSLSATVAGKVFSQIKYFNISYSGQLQVALETWASSFISLSLTPDIPDSTVGEIPSRRVPYVFEKYDVSSSFLINFWESLGIIIFATVAWMTFKGGEMLFKSQQKPQLASLSQKVRIMAQNFLISTLYGCYGDIVLFSLIEYRSFEFGWDLSLLSFIISITLLIVMFATFWYQVHLLLKYQTIKKQDESSSSNNDPQKQLEKFTKENEGNQVLFKDFKDYSLAPQLYLFILSGRDIITSLLLATMFEHPLAQTILITILNLLLIIYLFMKKPLESTFDLIQLLFFEIVGLAVGICVLINASLDSSKETAAGSIKSLGKTIIAFNFIFNLVTALLMLIMIISLLKEAYALYKARKAKNLKVSKLENRFQRPSIFPNEADSQQKSHNIFELSQISNQRFAINFESEGESLQQGSLDLDFSPPRHLHPSHPSHPSHQQLRIRRNLARIAQFDPIIQPPHHQVSRMPGQVQRFSNRQPLHQNNSIFTEQDIMNHERSMGNVVNRVDPTRKRRIIQNLEEPQLPLRFERR